MGVNKISVRLRLYQDDSKWAWKFVLRVFAMLLALAGIVCVAWATSKHFNSQYFYEDGLSLLVPYDLIPLGFSLIWNIANIAVLLARKRAIHPGANVGCDLIIWCTFFPTGLFVIFAAISTNSEYYTTPKYDATAIQYNSQISAVEYAGSVISCVLMLFHFALFVSACRYTHERRRDELFQRVKQAVKEGMEMEPHVPHPPVPQIMENGKPIPVTSEARPGGSAKDYPLPLSVPRNEGVNYPVPSKVAGNSWAPNELEV